MTSPIRVLLIESSEEDTALIGFWLHQSKVDFEVVCVDRLQHALEALSSTAYDVLLMDFALPDYAGMEGLIQLRARAAGAPILVLTDEVKSAELQQFIQLGAQECLSKARLNALQLENALVQAIERQRTYARTQRLATLDPLTQLYNEKGFMRAAQQQLSRARRLQKPFVVLLVDIDGLCQINRMHGSTIGDQALTVVAQALHEVFRTSDIVGRVGADEFAVLASDAHVDSVERLEQRLNFRVEEASVRCGLPLKLSCSLGAASWMPSEESTLELLLRQADVALYAHKQRLGPRNRPPEQQRFKPLPLKEKTPYGRSRSESIQALRDVLKVVKQGADYLSYREAGSKEAGVLDDVNEAVDRADAMVRELET